MSKIKELQELEKSGTPGPWIKEQKRIYNKQHSPVGDICLMADLYLIKEMRNHFKPLLRIAEVAKKVHETEDPRDWLELELALGELEK